jgi:hypothetical protein
MLFVWGMITSLYVIVREGNSDYLKDLTEQTLVNFKRVVQVEGIARAITPRDMFIWVYSRNAKELGTVAHACNPSYLRD